MSAADPSAYVAAAALAVIEGITLALYLAARADLHRAREDRRTAELKNIDLVMEFAEEKAKLYERLLDAQKADVATLVRLATTGSPEGPQALVQSPEPDAHQVLTSRVVEETILKGMEQMRDEYRRAGIPVPDDATLREEVEMLIDGTFASPSAGAMRA
jgi:hypothetical protein